MRIKLLFCYIMLLPAGAAMAQNQLNVSDTYGQYLTIQSRLESDPNVDGTPYLTNEWTSGIINFRNNSKLDKVSMRFNVQRNYIEVNVDNSIYMARLEDVKDFTYQDPETSERMLFKRIALNKNDNTVLRIILEDKITLGAYYTVRRIKAIRQDNGYMANDSKDKLKLSVTYYLVSQGHWPLRITGSTKSFLKRLPSHNKEMKTYIDENNLDTRDDEDLIKAVQYYNSIIDQ